MSEQGLGVLGEWTRRPRRNARADLNRVRLDHQAQAVLSRVDGTTSVREICAHSGLGTEATVTVLHKLFHLGLILLTDEEPRALAPTDDAEAVDDQDTRMAALREDLAYLATRGSLGRIHEVPLRPPDSERFGDFDFTEFQDVLAERCDLPEDVRRDILFISENLSKLDHYELLDIEPTDDAQVIRRAFFAFNKRFHPDRWFRKRLASYLDRITRIMGHVNNAEEALTRDDRFRLAYFRVVRARNAPYREASEQRVADEMAAGRAVSAARRDRIDQVAAERRGRALRDKVERDEARNARQRAAGEAKMAAAAKRSAEAEVRKAMLQERLKNRTQARRQRGQRAANPVMERFQKARGYYEEGMANFEKDNKLQAASLLRLAVNFDPNNEGYREAFERINAEAQQGVAETHWKRGYFEESVGRVKDALNEYLKAVVAFPRPDYLIHTAELLLSSGEDVRRAVELAQDAVLKEPENVEYLNVLGQMYQAAALPKKAHATYKRVLKLDPRNSTAKKQLRSLKRF